MRSAGHLTFRREKLDEVALRVLGGGLLPL